MVNVKKRKGRVVIDSDSEDSASDDNLDEVGQQFSNLVPDCWRVLSCQQFWDEANVLTNWLLSQVFGLAAVFSCSSYSLHIIPNELSVSPRLLCDM